MILNMNLGDNSYDIVIEHEILKYASKYLNLERKVMIVTDKGVPDDYSEELEKQCTYPFKIVIEQGEKSKNFENYKKILKVILENNFTRGDCVVAVGGGVIGDMAGFAAATYMRGIDFYNIPTTLLSQIDSSIGGKVAIDFEGYKNIVGAFYQPKKVLIDPDVLKTLDKRQISNGLAEAIKMSLTNNKELFLLIENNNLDDIIDDVIIKSLEIKKNIVEQDEKEKGLRMVLNFGHTIGHGIESEKNGELYHGECVGLGMIPMCSENVSKRLKKVLHKNNLPYFVCINKDKVIEAIRHDKKSNSNKINIVKVDEIGSFKMEQASIEDIYNMLNCLEEK